MKYGGLLVERNAPPKMQYNTLIITQSRAEFKATLNAIRHANLYEQNNFTHLAIVIKLNM